MCKFLQGSIHNKNLISQSFTLLSIHDMKSLQNNQISLIKNIDNFTISNKLPPLIKGYLKASGMVSKDLNIDREFETIDYCVIMLTNKFKSRYRNKFLNQYEY